MSDTRATKTLSEFDPDFRTPDQEMAELGAEVPDAADLLISQINPHNPHLFAEDRWQSHFDRLRAEDPVHFNEIEAAGRYWSITKYHDLKEIEVDWKRFSNSPSIVLGLPIDRLPPEEERIVTFIAMDPPEHRDQRRTVTPSVQPRNLENVEPMIRERTVEVLESLPEGETFDWVDTVSVELTTRMLATLFDFPFDDRRKLTRWSDVVFAIPEPGGIVESHEQRRDELIECVEYFSRLWDERRGNPGHDFVSMLANGEATKDMSPLQHLGNLLLLIVGGNDTTRNTMSGSVYGLNKFPEQYDKLIANPELIRSMVQEIIRWQTPLPYMRRTATEDVEFHGKQIRKNDQVLLWYISANRDTDVFENPDVIDIERANADQHLSFGYGIHRCMGSRLAEMQLRILWEEILDRFEKIEVMAEPKRTFSSFVHGYTELPVQIRHK
ncbi:MAG: cytochrome P450 [Ilumatobacter fluminis]|uniref:Cytochrome P450 n=2 Tax=Ilumatobacter fluminis TaxID=467091 RepID=A0A4R7HVB8_9ACTN|nr:cytochrome P450 [Ilumatobacter fluminis]TDT14765.1 cytochrome P450 [Ilumatobacter fluminis]